MELQLTELVWYWILLSWKLSLAEMGKKLSETQDLLSRVCLCLLMLSIDEFGSKDFRL